MPSPTSAITNLAPAVSGSLEEFSTAADRAGFIAHQVLPVFEAGKQAGQFGIIPIEQLLQTRDTARAPGSGYSRGQFTFTPTSYATEEHGAEEPIDDREAEMYSSFFDAQLIAAERSRDAVLRNAEIRAAALIFNSTTWTGSSLTTTITNEWDDAANATPLVDVEAAVQQVYANSGLWPNAIVLNRKVFRNLRNVDEIIDRIKYQGFVDVRAGEITAAALAQAFDLDHVIVAGGSKNTANEGQTASISPVWSDEYAMICKIATTNDIREPCIGRTFHWGQDGSSPESVIETYRDETVRSDIVRHRHDVDELVLYTQAGHLLSNATT